MTLFLLIVGLWAFGALIHAIGSSGRSHVEERREQQAPVPVADTRTREQRRAQFMARGF